MKTRNLVRCALFSALMCVSAWITVPFGAVSVTMQTFTLFFMLGVLGGKSGSAVCLVYLLLGAAGLPVFSGFQGGFGALFGPTGGYLLGFLAAALIYWAATALFGTAEVYRLTAMLLGLFACYGCGTGWMAAFYIPTENTVSLGAVLLQGVAPYLLPDGCKLALALLLTKRLKHTARQS